MPENGTHEGLNVHCERRRTDEPFEKRQNSGSWQLRAEPVGKSGTLIHDPNLSAQVNAETRSQLVHGAQHTHGNRATQRIIHHRSEPQQLVPVQRFDLPWGGIEIELPQWEQETDDASETDNDKKRRQQQQEEKDKGVSTTPREWWKPKPTYDPSLPIPWMPGITVPEPTATPLRPATPKIESPEERPFIFPPWEPQFKYPRQPTQEQPFNYRPYPPELPWWEPWRKPSPQLPSEDEYPLPPLPEGEGYA